MKEQKTFPDKTGMQRLIVKANGGKVDVEKYVEGAWVVLATQATDGCIDLNLGSSQTRFTPSGGAFYEIEKL